VCETDRERFADFLKPAYKEFASAEEIGSLFAGGQPIGWSKLGFRRELEALDFWLSASLGYYEPKDNRIVLVSDNIHESAKDLAVYCVRDKLVRGQVNGWIKKVASQEAVKNTEKILIFIRG
jgi:hypothetical protein